ncbi:hypothetical protein J2T21_000789 [Paeniglutamicibacter psychrophenolicus]|nr:hypothetical protein [Paeniglutamicibacter psychrophenolicus]
MWRGAVAEKLMFLVGTVERSTAVLLLSCGVSGASALNLSILRFGDHPLSCLASNDIAVGGKHLLGWEPPSRNEANRA